jgi:hypothetical protein
MRNDTSACRFASYIAPALSGEHTHFARSHTLQSTTIPCRLIDVDVRRRYGSSGEEEEHPVALLDRLLSRVDLLAGRHVNVKVVVLLDHSRDQCVGLARDQCARFALFHLDTNKITTPDCVY